MQPGCPLATTNCTSMFWEKSLTKIMTLRQAPIKCCIRDHTSCSSPLPLNYLPNRRTQVLKHLDVVLLGEQTRWWFGFHFYFLFVYLNSCT